MACVVPFMSCGAAFGILFFCGMRFGPILCVTPFLILAIGVDDSFLMLHAWHRVVKKARKEKNDGDSLESRLAEVLVESGPSITISAATNILAFTIGALTSPPEIQLFCYANATAIFVDTVFSETIYAAMMAIAGKVEMRHERTRDKEENVGVDEKETRWEHRLKDKTSRFLEVYLGELTKTSVTLAIILGYCAYVAISVWGVTLLRTDLDTRKFFLRDSILIEVDRLRTNLVVPHFTPVTIFVNNPGNLSDPKRLEHLNALVSHFESLESSIGPESTKYFMRDFDTYRNPFGEEESTAFDTDELSEFLKWPEYSFWKGFLKLREGRNKNGSLELDRFFFTTGYQGQKLKDWGERGLLLDHWREEVDKFKAEFNASIFTDDGVFLDLIEVIPSVTWQSVVATLICMFIVCFVFMSDLFTVAVASISISSICLGVFGLLSFWNINLDPIMMSAAVMAIGFSVDIPAHISYHYYRTGFECGPSPSVHDRLHHTLGAVGFPVIQAGFSTIICVASLLCVSLYMSFVFVKTMFLCIVLGLLHGFIVIPAIFNLADRIFGKRPSKLDKNLFRTTVTVGSALDHTKR
ncbi:hypothetical protein L596_014689 [Steinernema carpocapsae]|uniref:SSD domain-containing protein n=1 Tax=Steinernema carpocapsae TaxID=34508 RepID=A0A4U5NCM3_STECR|nr:hypothetical protein L596_014689 [Steinernema carpocapsae]